MVGGGAERDHRSRVRTRGSERTIRHRGGDADAPLARGEREIRDTSGSGTDAGPVERAVGGGGSGVRYRVGNGRNQRRFSGDGRLFGVGSERHGELRGVGRSKFGDCGYAGIARVGGETGGGDEKEHVGGICGRRKPGFF